MRIRAYGEYALFARPELKKDMVSYNMITPSAARGLFESVLWHPGMKWTVDRIFLINPILRYDYQKGIKHYSLLKNVEYIIEAHFELTENANASDNHGKFTEMAKHRLIKQKFYKMPYFGSKEYPATLELFQARNIKTAYTGKTNLGLMLYDIYYNDLETKPLFFNAVLNNGVLDLRNNQIPIYE